MPVRRETLEVANTGVETGAAGREVFDAGSVILLRRHDVEWGRAGRD